VVAEVISTHVPLDPLIGTPALAAVFDPMADTLVGHRAESACEKR